MISLLWSWERGSVSEAAEPMHHVTRSIYHIALAAEFRAGISADVYRPAGFDQDGFVHCAGTRSGVLAVANDYFANALEPLLILAVEPARLTSNVVFEPPAPLAGGGTSHLDEENFFPHVYGPLDLSAVTGVAYLVNIGGEFAWPERFSGVQEILEAPNTSALDVLDTDRLRLTRMTGADFDDLYRLHQDPQVMATLGGLRSHDVTVGFVQRTATHWARHGFGLWMLYAKGSGVFAGRGGLLHVTVGGREEVEVAYALMPEFWGRGLATELATTCVRIAFDVLRLPDLVCFTLPTNRASQRVMEKVGFCYERDAVHAELPHVLYRLTA